MKRDQGIPAGTRLGNLVIERALGRGACGVVYLARDILIGRLVALKVVRAPATAKERNILSEARMVAKFHHQNVVALFRVDHSPASREWLFEMEYVEGGSLQSRLTDGPALDDSSRLNILRSIAGALAAAHDAGVIHGDVKAANVLLGAKGVAKLADFGLAHMRDDGGIEAGPSGITGTPCFMAPEVIMGSGATTRSDVWSAGVLFYQVLTCRLPFPQKSLPALFLAVQNAMPEPLPREIPRELAGIVMRCLSKRPEDRPTASEIETALAGAAPVRPIDPPGATKSLLGREDDLATLLSALAALADPSRHGIVLEGELGAGKTHLLSEFGARATESGAHWIPVSAHSKPSRVHSLALALRTALAGTNLESNDAVHLLDEAWVRQAPNDALLASIESAIEALCKTRSLAIALDDADEQDALVIRALAGCAQRLPLLVIVSTERADLIELPQPGDAAWTTLRLGPLPAAVIADLVDAHVHPLRVEPALLADITQRANGNPMFALEVIRHLVDLGSLIEQDGTLRSSTQKAAATIPTTLRDLITRRLANLDDVERELLDVAAVDGACFDGAAIAAAMGDRTLDVLRRLQLLYRKRGLVVPDESGYRFGNPLLREVLYDELAAELKTELHRLLAGHLVERSDHVDPERLGLHLYHAGNTNAARPYLLAAAATARLRDPHHAIDLGRMAGLDPNHVDEDVAIQYADDILLASRAYLTAGREQDALAIFRRLRTIGETRDEAQLTMRAYVYEAQILWRVQGLQDFDEDMLLRAGEQLEGCREKPGAYFVLGDYARRCGNTDLARQHMQRCIDLCDTEDAGRPLNVLGAIELDSGSLDEADRLFDQAIAAAKDARILAPRIAALGNKGLVQLRRGHPTDAIRIFSDVIRTLELVGFHYMLADTLAALVTARFAAGQIAEATETLDRLLRVGQPGANLASAHRTSGEIAIVRGKFEDAKSELQSSWDHALLGRSSASKLYVVSLHLLLHAWSGRDTYDSWFLEEVKESLPRSEPWVTLECLTILGEAILAGVPMPIVEQLEDALSDLPPLHILDPGQSFVRAAIEMRRPAPDPNILRSGSAAVRTIGARRAISVIASLWIEAQAELQNRGPTTALPLATHALTAARALGHVWMEARLTRAVQELDR